MHLLTPNNMLHYNSHTLLRLLKKHKTLSRADIAKLLNCSRSTVSHIMGYLEENHLVISAGQGNEGVGRNSKLYQFNPCALHSIGIEIKKDQLRYVLADLEGTISQSLSYPLDSCSAPILIKRVLNSTYEFIESLCISSNEILGIGVMVPGPVSHAQRVIRSVPLGWKESLDLACQLNRKDLPPFSIINDANGKALAEACFTTKNPQGGLIYLDNHNGFGSGFVNSQLDLLYGANALAMEVGKMNIWHKGSFVQADHFLIKSQREYGSLQQAFDCKGNDFCEETKEISDIFGQIIYQLAALLNPDKIILDVPYIKSPQALEQVDKIVSNLINPISLIVKPKIELPSLKKEASPLGGVAHAFLNSSYDFVMKPTL